MKLAVLILFVCNEILAYDYVTKYIDLPVDHFSFTNNATFKLKYLINDSSWLDDGPIFFYTGNEGTIENFAENTGFIFDIAPGLNALIVFAEHRFYGESLPFGNASFDTLQHLGYLTSNQALADYVYLISYLQTTRPRSSYTSNVPVIAFGGSYGGMLAAWLRMKFPAAVIGAIASSAPIWQFQDLTPCENFNRIVTDVYSTALDTDCSLPIRTSWKAIRDVASDDAGKKWLSTQWNLCTPLNTQDDVDVLISWYADILINMAMVNYPYKTSFLSPLPPYPVRTFCYNLNATDSLDNKALITAIGSALEIYTNYTQTTKCNNINQTAAALGEDAWDFQACTEMIMPMCSTDDDMFENEAWNFDDFSKKCFKRWGVQQTREDFPILEYGGKDISAASNIVFSNGLLDPWSSGGVLSNISATVSAIIIPEGAHHLDLRGKNENDPQSVIEARDFHVRSIRKWIAEFYHLRDNTYFNGGVFYEKVKHIH